MGAVWLSRILFGLSALIWTAPVFGQAATDGALEIGECGASTRLCVGVRSDARPFSYKSSPPGEASSDAVRGPLRRAGYTGYMVRICDAVLVEMVLDGDPLVDLKFGDIGFYDIDKAAQATDAAANDGASPSGRFADLGKRFDILCDPATITNDRRDDFSVSPPLFLTGISYITRKGAPQLGRICADRKRSLIGLVGGTTAATEGIRALLDAHELPELHRPMIDFLTPSPKPGDVKLDSCGFNPADPGFKPRIQTYKTHTAAAKAFCDGEFYYLVGDLEIITANVRMVPGCDYENGTSTYTNDRYAVFGRTRPAMAGESPVDTMARRLLVARFFQIMSQKVVFNPSILDKAFGDTFLGVSPSRKLEIFFWSVRGERH
ncbi:extracellular solute-binding protein, family 3 [Kaistia soli DSM 19436]|uniref:Extracellular solute-binding protein, family 3 n=1 Tax=Kaistia soli DSM 19436 TaxID=1122133 RepID=A0A1M5N9J2_9HYPH|nr:transporter substrate-binding domain-containing protein [Kaistia soli]SHG86256.1 extracellular solute-binding protein, family 3 [Kaistia soli DSM 19436]